MRTIEGFFTYLERGRLGYSVIEHNVVEGSVDPVVDVIHETRLVAIGF